MAWFNVDTESFRRRINGEIIPMEEALRKSIGDSKYSFKDAKENIKLLERDGVSEKVRKRLKNKIDNQKAKAKKVYNRVQGIRVAMESIVDKYEAAEQALLDYQLLEFGEITDYRDGKKEKEKINNYNNAIQSVLQNVSLDVTKPIFAVYPSAKDLYKKLEKKVVVAGYNTHSNGSETSYEQGGILYLNIDKDMNGARVPGTTYYHEFGHFIVNYMDTEWIQEVEGKSIAVGSLASFQSELISEVSNYIVGLKSQGGNIKESLKAQLGDVEISDGLSDIIDGVCTLMNLKSDDPMLDKNHDKNNDGSYTDNDGGYNVGYGHDDSYWRNPAYTVHLGNEAFANMYAALMTGDVQELELFNTITHKSYTMFQGLINEALLKCIKDGLSA